MKFYPLAYTAPSTRPFWLFNGYVRSFRGRTVYYSPDDWKNLNRAFPGNAEGTVTDRIAQALTQDVIARADYVVDIHSGDANESLWPLSSMTW